MSESSAFEGRRILIVAEFNRTSFGSNYYKSWFTLRNGFVRAGANVITVSDRDTAREAGLLRHKAFGRRHMNQMIIDTAKGYRPHLILFGHVDMTGPDTLEAVRRAVPDARLAQLHVDPLFRERAMDRFNERATQMHASFITTGAPEKLAELGSGPGTVAFCPNPVDPSLAHTDVSKLARKELPHDGIFLGSGDQRREPQVRELQERLPSGFRFFAGGKIFGTPRLAGPEFLETMASGAMSPNLPLDERRHVDYLYSSSRLAQLIGLGVTAFCQANARLEDVYEDGIVNYTTIEDLAGKMASLAEDDDKRRRIGATGRRIGRERTGNARVARYLWDMTVDGRPSEDFGWPSVFH